MYAHPGYLLYRRESALVAHAFDPAKLELKGDPIPIAEDVGFDATSYQGYFSASDDGVVVHHSGSAGLTQFTWTDRKGQQLGTIDVPADQGDLELSPDGKRLIFRRVDFQTGSISLWLTDLERGTSSRFTFEKTSDFSPIWSPDGSRIVFSTLRDGPPNLYRRCQAVQAMMRDFSNLLSPSFHSTGRGMVATSSMEWSTPRLIGTYGLCR